MNLRLTPASYWKVSHIRDQVVEINGSRLNVDLLFRVLRAKAVADLRSSSVGRAEISERQEAR